MLEFKISLRFIRKSFMQSLIIFLTIISSSALFFILSLGSVLKNMILDQSTLYKEHLSISSNEYSTINNHDFNLSINTNIDKYLKNSTYSTTLNGFLSYNDINIPFNINAFTNNNYKDIYGLNNYSNIKDGKINSKINEIMLHDLFRKKYNIKINDKLIFKYQNKDYNFIVSGFFDTGVFHKSYSFSYLNIDFFNFSNNDIFKFNLIMVLNNPNDIDYVINNLNINDNFNITSWSDLNKELDSLNKAQRLVVLLVEIFLSLSTFLVVFSILNFNIKNKYYELGIIKTLGFNNTNIKKIFIFQSLIISYISLIIGLLLGTIFIIIYKNIMTYPDGSYRFKVYFEFKNYFITFFLIFLSVLFACLVSIKKN